MDPSTTSHAVVTARAALAGNPSDAYGGAVVAIPVDRVAARATLVLDDAFGVEGSRPGDDLWQLVEATVRTLRQLIGLPDRLASSARVSIETTIPRSVGLAGSSAIVLAVMRALTMADPAGPWAARLADPDAEAVIALEVERTTLGIAAGLQDRLVQAHGRPVLMEFDEDASHHVLGLPCGLVTPLADPPGSLVVASRVGASEPSGIVHHGLAGRRAEIGSSMAELADLARRAADAVVARDVDELGAAMDATFEVRRQLLDLDPLHIELVDVVRAAGGSANYTGSGGSVVGLFRDEADAAIARWALDDLSGCTVLL